LRRLHFLLLDGFYLFHQIVRELHIGIVSVRRGFHVRLLPIEQVQVSHRVVLIFAQLNGFLQAGDALVNDGAVFLLELRGQRGRHGIRI